MFSRPGRRNHIGCQKRRGREVKCKRGGILIGPTATGAFSRLAGKGGGMIYRIKNAVIAALIPLVCAAGAASLL